MNQTPTQNGENSPSFFADRKNQKNAADVAEPPAGQGAAPKSESAPLPANQQASACAVAETKKPGVNYATESKECERAAVQNETSAAESINATVSTLGAVAEPPAGQGAAPTPQANTPAPLAAMYQFDPSAPAQPKPPLTSAAKLALGLSYLLGWLYIQIFADNWGLPRQWEFVVPFALFCIAFFVGLELCFRRQGRPQTTESKLWLAFNAVLAVSICATNQIFHMSVLHNYGYSYDADTLVFLQMLALHGSAGYWALCRAGLLTEGQSGPFAPLDAIKALLVPFFQIFLRIMHLWQWLKEKIGTRKRVKTKNFWAGVATLAIAVPAFCAAVSLLVSADRGFGLFLRSLQWNWQLPSFWGDQWGLFLWSLPVGAYLYGMLGGALKKTPDPTEGAELRKHAEALRFSPTASLSVALGCFLALYGMFFIIQGSYLLGGFQNHLPAGYTAADYARSGFFELCAIVLLNFCVLTVTAKLSHRPLRQTSLLKGLALALCGTNLLFAVISFSKLYLYISRFGFTLKRVQSAWFTLVLVALTGLAIASLLRPFKAVRAGIFTVAALLLLFFASQPAVWVRETSKWMRATGRIAPETVQEGSLPQAQQLPFL